MLIPMLCNNEPTNIQHIVCYPVAKGKLVNFVGFSSRPECEGDIWKGTWVSEASAQDVHACYEGFNHEAKQLIQVRFSLAAEPRLNSFSSRVCKRRFSGLFTS